MIRRAAAGAAAARRPLVVKLVADEAYERARRIGSLRRRARGVPARAASVRDRALRRARGRLPSAAPRTSSPPARTCATSPSAGGSPRSGRRSPQPAADAPMLPRRDALRARSAGRARRSACRPADGREGSRRCARRGRSGSGGVAAVVGDGPDRAALERSAPNAGSATAFGSSAARSRDDVLAPLLRSRRRAAHVRLGELPAHGRRGARGRHAGDRDGGRRRAGGRPRRRERPARPARRPGGSRRRDPSVPRTTGSAGAARAPRQSVGGRVRARTGSLDASRRSSPRPPQVADETILMVGRTRYTLPLDASLARKFDALGRGARRSRARREARRRVA